MKPSQKQPDLDITRITLSIHGDFFQQRCVSEVRKVGWEVLAEEYPISSGLSYGSLDIWAALLPSGENVNLLIECKKSHPAFRRWVFLCKPPRKELAFPLVKMRKNSLDFSDPKIDPYKGSQLAKLDGTLEPNIQTGFLSVDQNRLGIQAYAYGAREIRLDSDENEIVKSFEEANRSRVRPPHERIYHGSRQISLATKSIMLEELKLMEKQTYIGMPPSKLFIPVLITNAELVSCVVDPEGIDLLTGEANEGAVKFEDVKRLAYHFPIPEELYLYPQDVTGDRHVPFLTSASQMEDFKKLFIIIVQSSDLQKFLQDVKYYAKGLA